MTRAELPTIVIDTREQLPWDFSAPAVVELLRTELPTVRGTLPTGDYSVLGLETKVAIERKSLADFVMCCTQERERFFAEMERMRSYELRAVLIEANQTDVYAHRYRSKVPPSSVLATASTLIVRYGVHVGWCGSRVLAARDAGWMLRRAWEMHIDGRAPEALPVLGAVAS